MKMRVVFVAAVALAAVASAMIACSDPATRPEELDDAGLGEAEASLADAAEMTDAAAPDARPAYDGSLEPIACDASPCVVRVVAGQAHYCAIIDDGTVRCWGSPSMFGAGDAGPDTGATPVKVDMGSRAVEIAAAAQRTCVVHTDGTVDCWGQQEPTPTRLADVSPAKRVVLGTKMSCVVTTSDALECWGDDGHLGFGRRTIDLRGGAATTAAISNTFASVAFALDTEGELRSWGAAVTTLGRESSTSDPVPRPVADLPTVHDVASSPNHACAVSTEGKLFCWGAGADGRLGIGHMRDERFPIALDFSDLVWAQQVSLSDTHSCARMTSGAVYCWGGQNEWGERAVPKRGAVYIPSQVVGLPERAVSVAVGLSSTCALAVSGTVYCWGKNDSGQLGRGLSDTERHAVPAPVVFPSSVSRGGMR